MPQLLLRRKPPRLQLKHLPHRLPQPQLLRNRLPLRLLPLQRRLQQPLPPKLLPRKRPLLLRPPSHSRLQRRRPRSPTTIRSSLPLPLRSRLTGKRQLKKLR